MDRQSLRQGIAGLYPGYFALVMATGIVSLAAALLEMQRLALALFYINLAAYVVLWLLTIARLCLFLPRVWADINDHSRGPGFFTLVAGTCILGNQFVIVAGAPQIAKWFWFLGVALWLPIMYTFYVAMTVRAEKPPLEKGLNGGWMLAVVAVQALSVLGVLVAPQFGAWQNLLIFVTLCLYLLGCIFYLLIIPLVFYRFTFLVFAADTLAPPYWINMGAVAISTLAGATLILGANGHPLIQELLPFLKGFTLFFWALACWWIPLLVLLGFWRHSIARFPFAYDPQYWGMVFPLGMFATCTIRLAQAFQLPFLMVIPRIFIYIAFFAWLAIFAGLLLRLARQMRRPAT